MSEDPALPQDQGSLAVDGRSNQAGVSRAKPQDMAVLCPIICSCIRDPLTGVAGQKLYQMCVSGKLRSLDWYHASRYKPEVNYDMTQQPPAPIMDSGLATKTHDWLKGWIDKHWGDPAKGRPPFRPRAGLIRRPDVVTVIDPARPPTQDNLEDVIEIKFPGIR
ncbi:VRR-NUC domain-containing protein [Xanthomonas populi]